MARIKFLDVLEETRSKPLPKDHHVSSSEDSFERNKVFSTANSLEKTERLGRTALREPAMEEAFSSRLRDRALMRDSTMTYENAPSGVRVEGKQPLQQSTPSGTQSNIFSLEEHRNLWIGALFVFFGGMLFLSGYWLGKNVTSGVETERQMLLAQSFNDSQTNFTATNTLSQSVRPIATTVDVIPISPKPALKVVEPAIPERPVKKVSVVSSKEYIIQVSAHSTIDAARTVEDSLRKAGFSAYTSESLIGDSVFFRVRLRGFPNKKDAQDILAQIKNQNIGMDGFVLTLE